MEYKHIPVMLSEVIHYLEPKPGKNFIDCTLGGGGYSFALAKNIYPAGRLIAIDLDKLAIENAKARIKQEKINNITLAQDNFSNLKSIYDKYSKELKAKVNGVVFDLGLSSAQLEDRQRGFSFKADMPINMAFGQDTEVKDYTKRTYKLLNKSTIFELEKIIREYGEERYARNIANQIVKIRSKKPITRTSELVAVIKSAVPPVYKKRKIHLATKTFQALRIATNDELNNLTKALTQALEILTRGGRLVVVSYHSLEDRIVKNFFKKESRDCVCPADFPECRCGHIAKLSLITKKVIRPGEEELLNNPRARSAKLRAAIKR